MSTTETAIKIPEHIAIIMDGNNRWAKKNNLAAKAGHQEGAVTAKKIVRAAKKLGVKYLTLYTFSSENWNRPQEEVNYIMNLLRKYLKKDFKELTKEGVKIKFIGDISLIDEDLREHMRRAETLSRNNTFNLIIAISYGSRDEIRDAAAQMAIDYIKNNTPVEEVKSIDFDKYLYTGDIPDPDLFIRPGGELRISNFLLWQLAYSELYFTSALWPDFTEDDLLDAIKEYSLRERRYGIR